MTPHSLTTPRMHVYDADWQRNTAQNDKQNHKIYQPFPHNFLLFNMQYLIPCTSRFSPRQRRKRGAVG